MTALRKQYGLTQTTLAQMTGFSVRSIAGWEKKTSVVRSAMQKFNETKRLLDALSELMSAEQVAPWLMIPNPGFDTEPPIDIIARGESDRLWRMIVQIDAGVAN